MMCIIVSSSKLCGEIIKRTLCSNEVQTHWSGCMAGNHTFWLALTAASITSSWGQVLGSFGALVSWSVTKENGWRPLIMVVPVSKVCLFLPQPILSPQEPIFFFFLLWSGSGWAKWESSACHVLSSLSIPQVLVSLGASEKLALLSLGNQLLPHSSPRPASAKHCRKLIHLLRPSHSTWSQIPGVHPPAFIALRLPTLPFFLLYKPPTQLRAKATESDKLPINSFEDENLEEIYV